MEQPILLDIPDELRGPRIVIRPFAEGEAVTMYDAVKSSGEHLSRWFPWPSAYSSPNDALAYIRRTHAEIATRDGFQMGIYSPNGELLGGIGLHPRDWRVPAFEIGYWLRIEAEGHGYMSEAVQLMTALAFNDLGAERVMIRCDARNARSRAVPERLGYVYEGTMRHDQPDSTGKPCDTQVFSLLRAEFPEASARW